LAFTLNIEHAYYEQMKQYEPFNGICFADTLEMAEGKQLSLFAEENTERVKREKEADIMVVIGNPPYNVGQKNENDNNKNRRYGLVDKQVSETYAKASRASNKNALSDPYVKFFRWASNRLQGRDGVVCLVTNNSFIDQIAFDGMRMHLQKDFHQIYHLDLHGNVRKNPKISGTTHNVFGIQVGVGITIAIRHSNSLERAIKYHRVPEDWRKTEKLGFLKDAESIAGINWCGLQPNERNIWITEGMHQEFSTFLPIGSRDAKGTKNASYGTLETPALFKSYSQGAQTSRDNWTYDFNIPKLTSKMKNMIEAYNAELSRWARARSPKDIDNFVLDDETKIKWSSRLKECFTRGMKSQFTEQAIRNALYRPFSHRYLYFDTIMTHRQSMLPIIFPVPDSELENQAICLTTLGSEKPFMVLATNIIPDLHLVGAGAGAQCFPYYTYAEDGTNRRENITDWALQQFQTKYGEESSKWDIFHYVYAILHHPQYRELYKENLKHDLPHIPLVINEETFRVCVCVGKQLMTMHVQYESEEEYSLHEAYNPVVPYEESLRVEKMKLSPDRTTLIYGQGLTLEGIPQECFAYRLGNRSALEWVIDQYQVSTDKRSGITSDPNRLDDPEYIVRLVKQVVMVSVKTVKLVRELGRTVTANDWVSQ
jgi:predicted helicase